MKLFLLLLFPLTLFCIQPSMKQGPKTVPLQKMNAQERKAHPEFPAHLRLFTTPSGHLVGVGETLIVKCRLEKRCIKKSDAPEIVSLTRLGKGYYKVTLKHGSDAFALSQTLGALADVELAQPDFVRPLQRR